MTCAAAIVFLRHALATGPRPAADLERQAIAQGISSRTLDRARRELGVQARRQDGHWAWALPAAGERKDATAQPPVAVSAAKDASPPAPKDAIELWDTPYGRFPLDHHAGARIVVRDRNTIYGYRWCDARQCRKAES